MSNLLLFAAGSLRVAFGPLLAAFQAQTGEVVDAVFGPAGLLRQRIEAGERPHVFASANLAPKASMRANTCSAMTMPFTGLYCPIKAVRAAGHK